jgi:hypothetical protein
MTDVCDNGRHQEGTTRPAFQTQKLATKSLSSCYRCCEHVSDFVQRYGLWKASYYPKLQYFLVFYAATNVYLIGVPYLSSSWETDKTNNWYAWVWFPFWTVLATVFYELTRRVDPGYISPQNQEVQNVSQGLLICPTCRCVKYMRSKHCKICNRCVMRFDHHCPYTNACIGVNNLRFYFAFLCTIFIDMVAFVWLMTAGGIRMYRDEGLSFRLIYLSGAVISIGALALGVFTLILTHTVHIVRNVTTNEIRNCDRYSYLQLWPTYWNPFDLGCDHNIREFILAYPCERKKWLDKYFITPATVCSDV